MINGPAGSTRPASTEKHYQLQGHELQWDIWRFHVRADRRPGVILSQIEVNDGTRWRSVLYQTHMSEVLEHNPALRPRSGSAP